MEWTIPLKKLASKSIRQLHTMQSLSELKDFNILKLLRSSLDLDTNTQRKELELLYVLCVHILFQKEAKQPDVVLKFRYMCTLLLCLTSNESFLE